MSNAQGGGFQGNMTASSYRGSLFRGTYNALGGPFPKLVIAQSYPIPVTIKLVK